MSCSSHGIKCYVLLMSSHSYRKIMVQMVSAVSGHKFNMVRERLGEKAELVKFDPWSKFE